MSGNDTSPAAPTTGPWEPRSAARLDFSAILISAVGYGIYLVVALAGIRLLVRRKTRSVGRDITLAYSVAMLALTTAAFGTTAKTNTLLLIDAQYDQAVLNGLYCSRTNIATSALTTLQIFMSDGLLLYRSYIILDNNWYILALPCLVYLSILGLGITVNLLCAPGLHLPATIDLGTPFYSLTVALNLLLTLLIGFKLLRYRARVVAAGMGGARGLRELTSVVGILTESAALYAAVGLVYIATYVRNVPAQSPLQSLFAVMTYIAPALIVLRVALGAAYTRSAGSFPSHALSSGRTLRVDLADGGDGPGPGDARAPRVRSGAYGGYTPPKSAGSGSAPVSPYEKPGEALGGYELGSVGRV